MTANVPTGDWIYLIGHQGEMLPTTHFNHASDAFVALDQHNAGKERETRAAAGRWQLYLLIYVPASRNLDVARFVAFLRRQCRTLQHRLLFGIRMAAKLMLLCFANGKPLRDAKDYDKASQHLVHKVLAKLDSNKADGELNRQLVQERVSRYLQTPQLVYATRHHIDVKDVGDEFLNLINTTNDACFSTNAAGNDDAADDETTKDDVDSAQPAAKRAKKSMSIVRGLVSLQQSSAFNDVSLLPTPRAPSTLSAAPNGARRRQRNSLFNTQGVLDFKTLHQYGNALCVDMRSEHTMSNMKAVNGQNDQRCVCGTTHVMNADELSVIVLPGTDALLSYRCATCSRLSATYERYSIDNLRARHALQATIATTPLRKRQSADASLDDMSASGDSVDVFVQTLLVSFNVDGPTRPVVKSSRASTLAPKQLFIDNTRPLRVRTVVNNDDDDKAVSQFVYGHRSITCQHASLTTLDVPNKDNALIREMIKT